MSDLSADEVPKITPKRPDTLQIKKSSSQGEIELPNIQKKSSPVNSESKEILLHVVTKRRRSPKLQGDNCQMAELKRLRRSLTPPMDVSSCPNSPLNPRNRKSDKLEIIVPPVGVSGRVRTSSFTSSPEERVRTFKFHQFQSQHFRFASKPAKIARAC